MMLPPKSGRKAVRLRNAATMSTLSYLYSDIMAAWISSGASPKGNNAELLPRLRHKFLGLAQQIQAVKMQTMVAKWEGSLRGAWPGDEYLKLAGVQADMMSSLALVSRTLFFLLWDAHSHVSGTSFLPARGVALTGRP